MTSDNEKESKKQVAAGPELSDGLGAKERFLAAGWEYSHSIAGSGEICFDRSCFRCRLADLLFETEKRSA